MQSSAKFCVQLGRNFTPQRPSSALLVLSATVHIRQSSTWHGPAGQQSLALGAVVGDFRGPECQIGLSRPGDSSLLPPASPLPISHPTSLPPTVQLRNHILSWAQAFPGLGYGRATGEAKMGKGHVLEQKVWADSAGCFRNTDVSFSEVNARAFIIRANTISAGDKSPWLISCTRFYGNDVWMPPDLNWLFAITEPFHGGWWREPWTGNWGSSSVVL